MNRIREKYYTETEKEPKGEDYIKWLENKLNNDKVLVCSEYEKKGYDDDNESVLELVHRFDVDKYTMQKICNSYTNFRAFWIVEEIQLKEVSKKCYVI